MDDRIRVTRGIGAAVFETAGLTHEIRNSLAGIKGVADALLQRRQLTHQEREWMEAVRHEVMKIDARLRELLDVSQPRIFTIKPCSLNELISRVVLLATRQLQSSMVSVEFIDTTTEPLVMPLDSARIEDAVLNLVLNAIESIDGTGRVTICLRRRPARKSSANHDSEAVIRVTLKTRIGRGSTFILTLPIRSQPTSLRIRNDGHS